MHNIWWPELKGTKCNDGSQDQRKLLLSSGPFADFVLCGLHYHTSVLRDGTHGQLHSRENDQS